VLTGDIIPAAEAYRVGVVNRLYPADQVLPEAIALAKHIASKPAVAIAYAKQAVQVADEVSLQHGLAHERQLFYSLFATQDQKEGMQAFLEKRPAQFEGK
jgi:enoyl-CoA hydratase/carnithine racemase